MDSLVFPASVFADGNGQASDVVGLEPVLRAHERSRSHSQFQQAHATF